MRKLVDMLTILTLWSALTFTGHCINVRCWNDCAVHYYLPSYDAWIYPLWPANSLDWCGVIFMAEGMVIPTIFIVGIVVSLTPKLND